MAVKKKVVLIGDAAVGKTSLIRRYVFDRFDDAYITTIGSKVTKKEITVRKDDGDVDLKLMIWDILGREGYVSTHARTFAGVHGAILVADLTRRATLETLERYWIPLLFKVVENVPLVFACNKSDLRDEVTFGLEDLQQTASRYNRGLDSALPEGFSTSLSTSAKTGENVEKAFESLGHLLLSGAQLEDPIKDLYESLVAMGSTGRQTGAR
jgi:small GTP-binding protein